MAAKLKKSCFVILILMAVVCPFFFLIMQRQVSPSQVKFCQDVELFISRAACMQMEDNRIAIVQRAFPVGTATSSDIRSALGEYLHKEVPTTYGHREEYYLSIRPIDYILAYHETYRFSYDSNGILVRFTYDD